MELGVVLIFIVSAAIVVFFGIRGIHRRRGR